MNFSAYYRLAAVFVLGTLCAGAVPRSTPTDWHVDSLKATITINPDSSILVDETQVIPENDRYFGLRCAIPIGSEDRWDRNYDPGRTDDNGLRVNVEKVTVDGQSVAFHLDHYRHSFYQVMVDRDWSNSLEPGQHELNVVYRVAGAIRSVGGKDELYWNVTGRKLSIRYESVSAQVILPAGVPAESVQASSYAGRSGSPIETTKFSDGAEFSTRDVRSHESLSITMRWPQGYIHEGGGFRGQYGPPYFLAPLMLLSIYISARLYLRRSVERYSTAPQYEPPGGLSPAAMRYVVSGVIDGTSIAATLATLAVKGYIEVQAQGASFACRRTEKCDTDLNQLPVEEAAIAELLFDSNANVAGPARNPAGNFKANGSPSLDLEDAAFRANEYVDLAAVGAGPATSNKQYTTTTTLGSSDPRINVLVGATYTRLRAQLEGKYSTWNAWIVLLGMLATLIFGLAVVLSTGQESSSLFLVIWSFFFFQGFTAVMSMAMLGGKRKLLSYALFTLGFAGATFLAARVLAQDITWVPVASYIAMIVVNGVFVPLLRTTTAEGQKLLAQIRGYKLFLQETELDRMKVLGQTPTSMPRLESLPYAIALDLKEPWGDAMANTFASAMTTV
jgi:Predicted membrane protein (DUF2207)